MDSKNRLIWQTALIDTGNHAINGLSWSPIIEKHELREERQEPPYMSLSMIFLKSTNCNAFLILLRGDFRDNTLLVELRFSCAMT